MADGDGTQAPEPEQSFTDPLAGLGSSGPPEFTVASGRAGQGGVNVATSTGTDNERFRGLVDARLAEEEAAGGRVPAQGGHGEAGEETENEKTNEVPVVDASLPEPGQVPGVYPRQRAWAPRSQLLPQVLRRRSRSNAKAKADQAKNSDWDAGPRDEPAPVPRAPRLTAPRVSTGSAGVLVAVVLMIVFALVALQFVVSLVDSISSLFN